MYRNQSGALARPTVSASSFPPTPRYPYRPTSTAISFPNTPRYQYSFPPTPRYSHRPSTPGYNSGPYRPAAAPSRSATGPQRSGARTYRRVAGYPYTTPADRSNADSTARPPVPAGMRSSWSGPPPPPPPATGTRSSSCAQSGTPRGRSSCQICSFSQKPPEVKKSVYHDHFSSKSLRELLGVEFSLSGSYFCPSCKSRHSPYPTERTKLVLSDSTLHNFFAPPTHTSTSYEGDTQHVDYITISGATLETLFHAFKLEYSHHVYPVDVFIVAGYNDLVKNHSRDFIIEIIKRFGEYVRELKYKDNSPNTNTVTIGTLLYPPQLAWFVDDGPEPPNYNNQKEKIDWINNKIDKINNENGMKFYVGVHKYGIRVVTRKHKDEYGQEHHRHIKKHKWEQWRETVRTNMLHLTNDRRFVLGKAVNEYFMHRT